MSTTNHYDRCVAAQSVAATGVSVTATRAVPSSSEIPVSQQSLVTTLLEDKPIDAAQPVPPALPGTRPIPKSLFLASDDDDNDIGNNRAPSPLPVPTMDTSSDDDSSDNSGGQWGWYH